MTLGRVATASIVASALFFLVSNLSTWAETTLYAKNLSGLMACYVAGLPFLKNTVLGDLFFSGVMFGLYEWMLRKTQQKPAEELA